MTQTPTPAAAERGRHRQEKDRGRRNLLLALVAVVVLAAAVLSTVWLALGSTAPAGALTDMSGQRVALDPEDLPAKNQHADPAGNGRFQIPSVGLDVPVGALNDVAGEITPPGFTSVYWVRNRGVPVSRADQGTVFLVTHSLRGGGKAPGNFLIDVKNGKAAIPNGTTVIVDGAHYTVDASGPISKPQLAGDAAVWANTPNRLVIITCLQVPANTESVDNMIITAVRNP